MLEEYPDVLTVPELREILYIGRNKAYQLLEDGSIKATKIGRSWRITKDSLIRYIED